MLILFLIHLIGFCLLSMMFFEAAKERKEVKLLLFSAAFWPIIGTMLGLHELWEKYKVRVNRKVNIILRDIQFRHLNWEADEDDEFEKDYQRTIREAFTERVAQLTVKELEYIVYADRIKAIAMPDSCLNLITNRLINITFEQHVLEK